MRTVLYILIGLLVAFQVIIEISAESPCSVWARHPEQCSSDHYGN